MAESQRLDQVAQTTASHYFQSIQPWSAQAWEGAGPSQVTWEEPRQNCQERYALGDDHLNCESAEAPGFKDDSPGGQ